MDANRLFREMYNIVKRLENIQLFNHAFPFNNTVMQLIREVLRVEETGGHIISSDLAKVLGITRSAVSQMVSKLESKNIVKRVPDKKDRKIAFIELSDSARAIYEDMKNRLNALLGRVIEKLGDEKIDSFVASANEFVDAFDGVGATSAETGAQA